MSRFWCVGDWGLSNEYQQRLVPLLSSVDSQSSSFLKKEKSTILALGDNFYNDGVGSIKDSAWVSVWWEPLQSHLMRKWVACLGNHDYHQNPDAQVQFSLAYPESLWHMPRRYFLYTEERNGVTTYLLVLDTVSLCPQTSIRFAHVHPHHLQNPDTQWAWIEKTLYDLNEKRKKSPQPINIMLMGHYPIFSNGHHGDTPELILLWKMMKEYKVQAYLFGHDHTAVLEVKENILLVGSSAISYTYPTFGSVVQLSDISPKHSFYYYHPLHSVWSIDVFPSSFSLSTTSFVLQTNLWSLEDSLPSKTSKPSLLFQKTFHFP